MATFAHTETGFALDPQVNASRDEYLKRYTGGATTSWIVGQVPDGTLHGAKDNGDGTFGNPIVLAVVQASLLSASGFQDVCETGLGGAARFGTAIRAMSTSNDDLVYSLYQRFIKSTTFDKAKTAQMLTVLVTKAIMTAQERTAILAAWPNG